MDKIYLLTQLQSLRQKLHEIAEVRGSLTDPAVLAVSEEADQLIVALQYLQRNEFELSSTHRNRHR
ncbi:aspartyl-phosphate phosphatase Spo0E family protein [Paenibacillus sp. GSMTC-2017]|uniref:aspartyl-phosphate phosphatase Spo0E family protein n=1 Tax=Paenibacillus sp. GSMTC-2017 TaxID=2794350 RepID=UPI0018D5A99B|nr:aspartyl-phosphate phosphatase Spo0E family protein [Paenibacillus sp. GSMTC-2017]MBH5320514.1 aspartyl-phosphate phosphatase Spo0E family protein [Paenibacillus sp. GSMTC-2017]